MASVYIYLGDTKLSSKLVTALETKFNKKSLNFDYRNEDTDLDGKFLERTDWSAKLWDTVAEAIGYSGTKPAAKKIVSKIEGPGEFATEIETWDQMYKGKIVFKRASGDKTSPAIKKNSHPPHVSVKISGAKKSDLPKQFHGDLDELVKAMQKPASYEYVGGSGSNKGWSANFGKHLVHEQPGQGWKAYIDTSVGTGTVWRLYFDLEFDVPSKTLNVSLTQISKDH